MGSPPTPISGKKNNLFTKILNAFRFGFTYHIVIRRLLSSPRGRWNQVEKVFYVVKILLVKTYGNTFFIEGELWLFRWKRLIARWKEGAHSYTCVSLFGAEMTENNYYRTCTSNTPKNNKKSKKWHRMTCLSRVLSIEQMMFRSTWDLTKTHMCSWEHLLSNALSNTFNKRV